MPSLFDGLTSIGVDETGHGKGHTCITVVVCVCSIESGPCERVESLQMSGRF